MLLKFKKEKLFSIIVNEKLFFVSYKNELKILEEYNIHDILSSPQVLIDKFSLRDITLLVIPDYWIGNKFYPISSKKESVIEAFLSRKLPADYPDIPNSKDFFEYVRCKQDDQYGVMVYFPQEELFYKLYEYIFSNLSLYKITTPAFLWQCKLAKYVKDIAKGQKLFVHIYNNEAYICFFLNGLFLFSRTIKIFETEEDYIGQLANEILHSLRLFSQKTKKEVEKIYLISKEKKDKDRLSLLLDLDIEQISDDKVKLSLPAPEYIDKLGSIAFMNELDLSNTAKFLYISHREEKLLKEWSFFQGAGIITGIVLFVMMLVETLFLLYMSPSQYKEKPGLSVNIENYIKAADEIIFNKQKLKHHLLILKVINSLVRNVFLKKIKIKSDPIMHMQVQGYILASDISSFKDILFKFISNLKNNIPCIQQELSLEDVDVKKINKGRYEFEFKIELAQE